MKAIIRISTRLRSCAPIPREFGTIQGLEHLGLIYQQKIITTPEDFNETLVRVSDSRFPSRGCAFFPYILTREDEAKMQAPPADSTPADAPPADDLPPAGDPPEGGPDSPPVFRLEGQKIFNGDTHIAGIFGEKKQLRVLAAHSDMRTAIEAWLPTSNPKP